MTDDPMDDPMAHYPWLDGEPATEAERVIRKSIEAHMNPCEDDLKAAAVWILEDLAHAGLEIVRKK